MTKLTVSLWNRDLTLTAAQVDRLQTYILDRLSRTAAGRESVSYLVELIRSDTRLKFPTRMVDAESMFTALGFTLDRVYGPHRSVRATYVTL